MEENSHIDPETITTKHVDIQKVLASKNVKLPKWMVRWVERLLHVEEINYVIYNHRYKFGLDFVHAFLEGTEPHDLNVKVEVVNPQYLPQEGYPIIAGNHPLGGPDGLALMGAIGRYRQDIKFPVNDFLLYLPGPAPLFVPIDKVHRNTSNVGALEAAFAGQNALLYFPAGLCSRKRKGGMGLYLGIGLALSFGYIMLQTVSATFAINAGTPAMLAAWIPNIIFAVVAWFCYRQAPR